MLFGGLSAFEVANLSPEDSLLRHSPDPPESGGLGSNLTRLLGIDRAPFGDQPFDTIIVGSALIIERATPGLLNFLTQAMHSSRRVSSMCTGAFYLAQAGLLDDRRATTHWAFARRLQAEFPKAKVDEDLDFHRRRIGLDFPPA